MPGPTEWLVERHKSKPIKVKQTKEREALEKENRIVNRLDPIIHSLDVETDGKEDRILHNS